MHPRACQAGGLHGSIGCPRARAGGIRPPGHEMTDSIIVDTATRIFADLCEPQTINAAEEGKWPQALWDALEESGLSLTWVPDTLGGAGAARRDPACRLAVGAGQDRRAGGADDARSGL